MRGAPGCNDNGIPDFIEILDDPSLDEIGDGSPDECECPDVDGDETVGIDDVLLIISAWGPCVG